jgi:sodium-dependent dicarboxylate transporter 2/3/5
MAETAPTYAAEPDEGATNPQARRIGFVLGLALAIGLQLLPRPDGLSPEAWRVASIGLLMAVWWVSEALPLPVTALVPLVALPLLAGFKPADAAAQYADPVLYLFLGGFLIAIAIERWGLSARLAYSIVAAAGPRPRLIVAGFMIATAFISMWISNTATSMMMTPLALGVAGAATLSASGGRGAEDPRFAFALILGVCHAATIGGVGTPIGSPTNLIATSWLAEQKGVEVAFLDWMAVGMPVLVTLLMASWFMLTRGLTTDRAAGTAAQAQVRTQLAGLGPMRAAEIRVALIFVTVACLWVGQQWLARLPGLSGLSDMVIAMIGGLALFVLPAGRGYDRALLTWQDAAKVPWGIILLFGGGLALADAATATGLAAFLGGGLAGASSLQLIVLVLGVVAVMIFITEFASNVASITMMLPILGALVLATGQPAASFVVPAAIAASTGFMMPVGTAANAIAYGTGRVPAGRMMRIGLILNLIAAAVLTAVGLTIAPAVLG